MLLLRMLGAALSLCRIGLLLLDGDLDLGSVLLLQNVQHNSANNDDTGNGKGDSYFESNS